MVYRSMALVKWGNVTKLRPEHHPANDIQVQNIMIKMLAKGKQNSYLWRVYRTMINNASNTVHDTIKRSSKLYDPDSEIA